MRVNRNVPTTIWTNPIHFIACAFGFGALPWAPGTWATLASIPIIMVLKHFPNPVYLLITFSMILVGIYVCGVTNQDFGTEDHPACAWDEMASFPLVLFNVPFTFWHVVLAVGLFRFFDILKPWPISWLDRNIHGGLGVMLDDVVAATVSWLIIQIILTFL